MTDLSETIPMGVIDINNVGNMAGSVVVGTGWHASYWDRVAVKDIGTLGGEVSISDALNDLGQVIGESERAPGGDRRFYGFLWENGKMVDLAALGGFSTASVYDINNCGEVLGAAPDFLFMYHPDYGFRDLASLIPAESDWWQLSPRAMNDRGQIVGVGTFQRRYRRPFLMTPVHGDLTVEGSVDLADYDLFWPRITGPRAADVPGCERADLDNDADVDLRDYALFQWRFSPR